MKTCLITGLKTNSQWKGNYIHPIALKRAKRDFENKGKYTSLILRDCIENLAKKFKESSLHQLPNNTGIDVEKYVNFINDFFLDDIEVSE